jgi:hypothetical protein
MTKIYQRSNQKPSIDQVQTIQWLLLWYLLVIVLSVRRLFTASDYPFGIFWSLYCPYFVYLRLLFTPLVYFGHFIVTKIYQRSNQKPSIDQVQTIQWQYDTKGVIRSSKYTSVLRLFTASDYSFGIFWSLYCLYFVYLQLLITLLVYFGHCIVITSYRSRK